VKKLLVAGLLALGCVLTSQQQASAWSKFNFSIGANLSWESANNNTFWGMFRSGQVPGYPTDVFQGVWSNPGFGGYPVMGGYPGYGFDHGYGYGGYGMPMDHAALPGGQPMPTGAQPAPAGTQPQATPQGPTQAVYYNNYNYQTNGYYPSNGGYYNYSNYGYQGYGYGNYQVPSYWYGR
jgi:hypothetical protein